MTARSGKLLVLLLFVLSSAGCAGQLMKNYGSFESDKGITQEFEASRVRPGVHYFISGSDVYPNAILALNRQYILEESLWKPVDMTPELLKELVWGMQKRAGELGLSLMGWSVRDEKGQEIGVWYSVLFATTSVKVDGNRATIYRPSQDTYREHEVEKH